MEIKQNASIMASLIGVVASLVAATILFTMGSVKSIKIGDGSLIIEAEHLTQPTMAIKNYQKELNQIKTTLNNLTVIPTKTVISSEIKNIQISVKKLESEIAVINKAIMQSPEKALSVPMLRKDIEALKLQNENTAKSLAREIGSAYEIIRWVLGTIVLGILGIAASIFIAVKDKNNA